MVLLPLIPLEGFSREYVCTGPAVPFIDLSLEKQSLLLILKLEGESAAIGYLWLDRIYAITCGH